MTEQALTHARVLELKTAVDKGMRRGTVRKDMPLENLKGVVSEILSWNPEASLGDNSVTDDEVLILAQIIITYRAPQTH